MIVMPAVENCKNFDSLAQAFQLLNENCEYVVLRNYEEPENYNYKTGISISVLTQRKEALAKVIEAQRLWEEEDRCQYKIQVENQDVFLILEKLAMIIFAKNGRKTCLKQESLMKKMFMF